jgi:hypothetical protein
MSLRPAATRAGLVAGPWSVTDALGRARLCAVNVEGMWDLVRLLALCGILGEGESMPASALEGRASDSDLV